MDDPCWRTTVHGRPLLDDHCSWTTPVGRPLFDDHYSWTTPVGRPLFDGHCSWTTPVGRPLFDDLCSWTTPVGRPLAHLTVQSEKTITWFTGVRIEKFESLTSSSLMGLRFIKGFTSRFLLFLSQKPVLRSG